MTTSAAKSTSSTVPASEPLVSPGAQASNQEGLSYFLFVVLTGVMLLRPSELVATDFPFYKIVIVACLLLKGADLLRWVSLPRLIASPICFCVAGLIVSSILSRANRMELGLALEAGTTMLKIAAYFFLLITVVNSPKRLANFSLWIVIFIAMTSLLALLDYHEVMEIQSIEALSLQSFDPNVGTASVSRRLRGIGIFRDPNDLCVILILGMCLALYVASNAKSFIGRLSLFGLCGMFVYSLLLTNSRGGFLSFGACLVYFAFDRFGKARGLLVAIVAISLVVFAATERQKSLELDNPTDSSHERIRLWSVGLTKMKSAPILGIGWGRYEDVATHVAHNSFIHAYVELGLLGGVLFLGLFYFTLDPLRRLRKNHLSKVDPRLRNFHLYLSSATVASVVSLLFLSRNYVLNIYLLPALATAYFALIGRVDGWKVAPLDRKTGAWLVSLSIVTLFLGYIFVKSFVRWSG